jgi:hypothetical protein
VRPISIGECPDVPRAFPNGHRRGRHLRRRPGIIVIGRLLGMLSIAALCHARLDRAEER